VLKSVPDSEEAGHARDLETFAVVLYFDKATERRVRQVWAALDLNGVPSVASSHGVGYRPHLTLAIIEAPQLERSAGELRASLAGVAGLPVTLTSLGFFLTGVSPAYLAVTPTSRLLSLHEQVHEALGGAGGWDYYRPGAWVPHCTLAMGVTSPTAVAEVVGEAALPIHARVSAADVVLLPGRPGSDDEADFPRQATGAEARHRAGPRHRGGRRLSDALVRW
jgi:2'-5' RNA ligase